MLAEDERPTLQTALDSFARERAKGINTGPPTLSARGYAAWEYLTKPYLKRASAGNISKRLSDLSGLLDGMPVVIDTAVVRGFTYYTGPVFQIDVRKEGRWIPEVGGGGRYDMLIGNNLALYGIEKDVPATGFAFGTERVVAVSRLPKGIYSVTLEV